MNSPIALSKRLLEVLPPIVQNLRSDARIAVKGQLTLPQFRILGALNRGLQTVGAIAEEQGVAQPTASKMVDGLVKRGLIKRVSSPNDRRQIHLELSKKGISTFQQGKQAVQMRMSLRLKKLSASEREILAQALNNIDELVNEKRDLAKAS